MQQILVYADSLSWGIVPETRRRLPFSERWPGVVEAELTRSGTVVRVIEDCLNGRRTAWDDPVKLGRNGRMGIEQRIEVNSPLALVIVMLGTNDFQAVHRHTVADSAEGLAALVHAVREAPIEPGMPMPDVLIVAPPVTQTPLGSMVEKFDGASAKSAGLAAAYQRVATALGCHFLDAGSIVSTSVVDGVHLDADQHLRLARAMAPIVASILSTLAGVDS